MGGGQAPEPWVLIGRRDLKVYCGWPSGSGAMDFDWKAYREQSFEGASWVVAKL